MDYRVLDLGSGVRFYTATRLHLASRAQVERDKKDGLIGERVNTDAAALEGQAHSLIAQPYEGRA